MESLSGNVSSNYPDFPLSPCQAWIQSPALFSPVILNCSSSPGFSSQESCDEKLGSGIFALHRHAVYACAFLTDFVGKTVAKACVLGSVLFSSLRSSSVRQKYKMLSWPPSLKWIKNTKGTAATKEETGRGEVKNNLPSANERWMSTNEVTLGTDNPVGLFLRLFIPASWLQKGEGMCHSVGLSKYINIIFKKLHLGILKPNPLGQVVIL